MPKRLPTTLEKLSAAEQRLTTQAALLKKQRDALARQRKRMQRQAQQAHLLRVGKLVNEYLETDDLGALEEVLKRFMMLDLYPNNGFPTEQPMSNTLFAGQTGVEEEGTGCV